MFERLKVELPQDFERIAGHSELPMPDDIKRLHATQETLGDIFAVEQIEKYLANGGTLVDQHLLSRDAYAIGPISDETNGRLFEFMTVDSLAALSITMGPLDPAHAPQKSADHFTQPELEKALEMGMKRWMATYDVNQEDLSKAYEHLKEWRFTSTPKDNIFEKAWKTKDFMKLWR